MSASPDMWWLVNGYQVSEALHVAAELQISDLLADGPRPVDELADAAVATNRRCIGPNEGRLAASSDLNMMVVPG